MIEARFRDPAGHPEQRIPRRLVPRQKYATGYPWEAVH
jgi:hypothetical protein